MPKTDGSRLGPLPHSSGRHSLGTASELPLIARGAERPELKRKISAPSCQALRHAVSTLYRMDDFHMVKIGAGFFSEVFKVTHKTTDQVMVLKMNKHRSNRNNMLKEVQLMNKLNHPNILKLEAACVHEGQLHALTEYINGGSLEQLIQRKEEELPWSIRISVALDIAKGLAYLHSKGMFHRDLTSKNVLINRNHCGKLSAVVGDFGLAAKIPSRTTVGRLPQVGSPYWMSPECLRGKYYDEKADVFSYGIIMCELIARVDADPDILKRTENFGVDYIAFSTMCPECPPDFLKLAFTCVKIDPQTRPSAKDLVVEQETLFDSQKKVEGRNLPQHATTHHVEGRILLRKVGHKRSLSEEEVLVRRSPSDKARFHLLSVMSVGKEMSLRDPHYRPSMHNPFATLPRLREGRKIIGSSRDLFSSCFELPSPARAATPTGSQSGEFGSLAANLSVTESLSLPSSRRASFESILLVGDNNSNKTKFEDHLFHGRVELLKRLYSGGTWITQDDSALELSSFASSSTSSSSTSGSSAGPALLRRRGSCESGFYSVGTVDDWLMGGSHLSTTTTRSIGSSLLTVSDLEEDLRAASAFLSSTSHKRTSSVFTDSTDDLSSLAEIEASLDDKSGCVGFEKDIRDIVDYFEASCQVGHHHHHRRVGGPKFRPTRQQRELDLLFNQKEAASIPLPRSQKIESLIKRVVEKESRERLLRKEQRLQVCDGIVRSKLPLFDETKRSGARARLPYDHQGFVKSKLAIFDSKIEAGSAKKRAEKQLLSISASSTGHPIKQKKLVDEKWVRRNGPKS